MADDVKAGGQSAEYVVLLLTQHIGQEEAEKRNADQNEREYWLTLYSECLKVVAGNP